MAPRKIASRNQLPVVIERIGRLLQGVANRKQRLESRIAKNEERVNRDRKELTRLTRQDEVRVFDQAVVVYAYAVLHRDELVAEGTATGSVDTGSVRWYLGGGGKLIVDGGDDDIAIEELKSLRNAGKISQADFDEVIKTELTIKRNPLKDRHDIVTMLRTTYVQQGSFFAIEPVNAGKGFSHPVYRLNEAAVERGLLPVNPAFESQPVTP